MDLFTTKYAPKNLADIHGQNAAIEQLLGFIKNHKKGTMCLLYGPQGVGKTAMVHAAAASVGAELLEVNASDTRNEQSINALLGAALKQQSLFNTTKVILFDEIDGLSGTDDRGGLSAVIALAKETTFPIIMTANDPWDSKFSNLRKNSVLVQARNLAYTSIVPVLKHIADEEHLTASEEALKTIARRSGGDMRAAIIDLQTLHGDVTEKNVDTLSNRNSADTIFNAVRLVLKTKDPSVARQALDSVHEDLDEIFLWMDENLAKEYRKPDDLARAYAAFSQADVFRGRIRRWQHWRLMVYCYDLIGPGVALAKDEKYDGFTQLTPTQRLFTMWRAKNATRDRVVEKLAKQQHISKKQARTELRILKHSLQEMQFFDEEEREWLSE